MKKKVSLATVLILSILLLSVIPAQAQKGTNTAPSSPLGQKTNGGPLYPWTLVSGSSNLYDVAPNDYDRYEFDAYGPGWFEFEVRDCCVLGDTMAAYAMSDGKVKSDMATSPDTIYISYWVETFRSVRIYVGYSAAPGGFPAGYDWRAYVFNP